MSFRWYPTVLMVLVNSKVLAMDSLTFKQSPSLHNGWLTYSMAIVILLGIVLVLAKKHRFALTQNSQCQLIEKKYLGNKTVVYVIDYQQQRFLLADNQHALSFHALQEKTGEGHE